MSRRRSIVFALAPVLAVLAGAAPVRAAEAPVYDVRATWADTNLLPGGEGQFQLQVRDDGGEPAQIPLTIEDRLPEGVTVTRIHWDAGQLGGNELDLSSYCSGVGSGVARCVLPAGEVPSRTYGYAGIVYVDVAVAAEPPANPGVNVAAVSGGGAAQAAIDTDRVPFSSTPAPFEVVPGSFEEGFFSEAYPFGQPLLQAGAHPFEQRIDFELSQASLVGTAEQQGGGAPVRYENSKGLLKTVEVMLPPGAIGNPQAVPKCDPVAFAEGGRLSSVRGCPSDTQVGYINIPLGFATDKNYGRGSFPNPNGAPATLVPIYNLQPPKGTPVDLAFNAAGLTIAHIYAVLDPSRNYAIKAVVPNITDLVGIAVRASETTLWGVPADPAHDRFRFYPELSEGDEKRGAPWGSAPIRPFFTNGMACGAEGGGATIRVASYEHPNELAPPQEAAPVAVEGCDDPRFRFEPEISLEPTDRHAGAPTGLEVKLKVPQRNDEVKSAQELYAQNGYVKGIATPPIKKTVVTLPEGMTLNPSAGQGLSGCSLEQLGMSTSGVPNGEPVQCPASAQIGTLVMHSPDLPITEPLEGRVYIARQGENPFGSLFALYLVLENAERGFLVKLAGKIELDPITGKITTTFDNLPQFPVADFQLRFKSGPRAALVNPATCGPKTITAEYFSWQAPNTPVVAYDHYDITENPDGSPCVHSPAEWPFGPQLSAGTLDRSAGGFAPFTLRLTRGDTEQQLSGLSLTLPPGLSGKLAGVQECPDVDIEAAQALDHAGQGVIEQAHPSCPAGSLIGESLVSAGTGPSLSYVPGKVYFAGPYKGAPFSVVVITPSVVGPYDLGTVTVRNALFIDPTTAQVHVVSDTLPKILDGIFVRIRDLRIAINRPGFIFNPTNCAEQRITGSASAFEGASATFAQRFQAANCATLGFKPKFSASTSGKPSRSKGASLDVRVAYPKAVWGTQANIRSVKVDLPRQLPSRLETLQQGCLDRVFEANPAACPAASRVGMAIVRTPVLSAALIGPAYFVSHGAREFPDLIIVLQGDGVTVELRGQTHISKAGITSSIYRTVPDVPFESFELKLPQGPYSALAAHGSLCKVKGGLKMPTMLTAQNGVQIKQDTQIKVVGCHSRARGKRHGRHKRRKKR